MTDESALCPSQAEGLFIIYVHAGITRGYVHEFCPISGKIHTAEHLTKAAAL